MYIHTRSQASQYLARSSTVDFIQFKMESNNNSNNNSAVRVVSTGRAGAFVNVREGQTIEEAAAAFAVAVSADSPPGAVPVAVPVHIPVASKPAEEDAGVIAAPASVNTSSSDSGAPAEIPPEPSSEGLLGNDEEEEEEDQRPDGEEEEDDDESEYEYEDDEDAAFSGFLVDHPPIAAHSHSHAAQSTNSNTHTMNKGNNSDNPARIRDEEESVHNNNNSNNNAGTAGASSAAMAAKPKWREPSRAAVSMSLRAEREKTGSKRRLAQDLYRIMNQETEEAGFSIAPKSEDNMDHWIIKLFMFDDDSNLAKDMLVLGFEHIELEMTFPDQYPFEPPFVRVVRPRFKRQTGFVMNGALCMELLTKVRTSYRMPLI